MRCSAASPTLSKTRPGVPSQGTVFHQPLCQSQHTLPTNLLFCGGKNYITFSGNCTPKQKVGYLCQKDKKIKNTPLRHLQEYRGFMVIMNISFHSMVVFLVTWLNHNPLLLVLQRKGMIVAVEHLGCQ